MTSDDIKILIDRDKNSLCILDSKISKLKTREERIKRALEEAETEMRTLKPRLQKLESQYNETIEREKISDAIQTKKSYIQRCLAFMKDRNNLVLDMTSDEIIEAAHQIHFQDLLKAKLR